MGGPQTPSLTLCQSMRVFCSVLIDTTSEKLDGGHVGNYYRLQAKQLGEVLSSMPAQQRDSGLQVG